jgi:hypothetical protein
MWRSDVRVHSYSELSCFHFAICFSHPHGTHDDVWWAVALSVYATIEMKKLELEAFAFG